jgi:hypothetical protein
MTLSRRDFVHSAAAGAGASLLGSVADAQQPAARDYYELRAYHLRRGPHEKQMSDYFKDALVPALRRAGTGPVGVFTVMVGPDSPTFYVLVTHPSMDSVATLPDRLAADQEYLKAGAAVIDAPAAEAPYERIETSLFLAFAGHPRLTVPPQLAAGKPRLFELRRYESHSEKANATKISVFNQWEAAIFARHNMFAVFYGQAIAGPRMPNLTYLLAFDDMRDRDARWGEFGPDPEWRAIASKPEYSDPAIVSSISNMFLRPTAYSQI